MAISVSRIALSGSTNGKGIKVVSNSSPGFLIHTATSSSTPGAGGIWDEVWMWVYNSYVQDEQITIQFGGATSPDQSIIQTMIRAQGVVLVVPGLLLQNGATVKAYSNDSSVCVVTGFVNRITNP